MGLRLPSLGPLVTGVQRGDQNKKHKKKQELEENKNKQSKDQQDSLPEEESSESIVHQWTQIEYEKNDVVAHLPNVISLLEYAKEKQTGHTTELKEKALKTYQKVGDIEASIELRGLRLVSKS